MSRQFTYEEVSKHNDKNSVWMVIHDNVYDVTSFLEEHPGGEESLLDVAGRESSQEFDDIGHSEDAKELLKKYKIGSLAPGEIKQTKRITPTASCCPNFSKSIKAEKTWRTFEGDMGISNRRRQPRPRGRPCGSSGGKWKYILALASAILIGIALKKYISELK